MKAIILIFLCLFSFNAGAYSPKEGNVHAVFGPYFTQTYYRNSIYKPSPTPSFSGFSLIAQGDANQRGNVEIAINYFNKVYFREDNDNSLSEQIQNLQITMGYRYWLDAYWSTALAFSSGYPLGDPHTLSSRLLSDSTFETSAHDPSESGLDLSISYDFWNQEPYSAVIDFHYTYSLTSRSGESADNLGALIGLRYLIQEKYKGGLK